jgi:hypothetical protein
MHKAHVGAAHWENPTPHGEMLNLPIGVEELSDIGQGRVRAQRSRKKPCP